MAGILGRAAHAVVSALTPDRGSPEMTWGLLNTYPQPVSGPTLSSVAHEPGQFVRSLDPRTPAGAFNLATFFMGRMTPQQRAFLKVIEDSSHGRGPTLYQDDAASIRALQSNFGSASPGGLPRGKGIGYPKSEEASVLDSIKYTGTTLPLRRSLNPLEAMLAEAAAAGRGPRSLGIWPDLHGGTVHPPSDVRMAMGVPTGDWRAALIDYLAGTHPNLRRN